MVESNNSLATENKYVPGMQKAAETVNLTVLFQEYIILPANLIIPFHIPDLTARVGTSIEISLDRFTIQLLTVLIQR